MRKHNLHERELSDTRALYETLKGQAVFDMFEIAREAVWSGVDPPPDMARPLAQCLCGILSQELYFVDLPPPPDAMTLRELTEYRQVLFDKRHFIANQDRTLSLLNTALTSMVAKVVRDLPLTESPTPFAVPLIHTLDNPKELVGFLSRWFRQSDFLDRGMFRQLSKTLYTNLERASGRTENQPKKPLIQPEDSLLAPVEMVRAYLRNTPLEALLNAPVPLKLSLEDRYNHMHVVGGTGAGKTTLIENLILHDIQSEDPPSLVIIDPHGDLIHNLTHADLGIENRLIIIDPRDIKHPPALNIFALNQDRLGNYDDVTREQVTAGVIQTFDYLFSGLIGAELTAKQGVFFRYVARLMLSLPDTMGRNATILDMLKLMEEAPRNSPPGYIPPDYRHAISQLPDIPREFFERDFPSKTFQQTKEQIRYRLQSILENPTMARLFTSTETKVDLFDALNSGKIILVDTAQNFLKGASDNFGRIFISLVLQAVLERSALPESQRKPTFLIVDEAASYFDSNIDDLLTEARKYKCGLVLAHQYLDQASSSLKASLAANTGAKFASGLSSGDARAMAPDMRTTADFILAQPALQFAAHIRNVTPHAVSIPVQVGSFDRIPKLSREEYDALLERNRSQVSLRKLAEPPRERPVSTPDEDISPEWR